MAIRRSNTTRPTHRTQVSRRDFLRNAGMIAGGAIVAGVATACGAAQPNEVAAVPTAAEAATTAPTVAPAATTAAATTAAGPTAAATAAAAAGAPKMGGKLIWALDTDVANILPFGAVATQNQWGKEGIYDSLVAWDKDLKIVPALAESWENPDEKTWIWHLKQGAKFHDGSEVTAEDVKYSMELQKDPPKPGVKLSLYPKIDSVEAVDKYTVKFNMAGVDPTVLGYLAWSRYSPIIPKDGYTKFKPETEGIGTGPFKLAEYVPNDHLTFTKFQEFWGAPVPYLDELTLKILPDESARVAALRSGAIDGCTVIADTARTLGNDKNITVLKGLYAAPAVLQFTMKGDDKPWNKKEVRQAISKALDRQMMIDNVFAGDAMLSGPVPPGYGDWFIDPQELAEKWFKQDVDAARKLMEQAGFQDGFKVTLYAIANQHPSQISEIVKEQLKAIKVDVTVVSEEIGSFAKRNGAGDFDMCATYRGMRHDPTGFVNDFGNTKVGNGKVWFAEGKGWSNAECETLFAEALGTLDDTVRHKNMRRIQEIVLDEAPHIFLVQPYWFHAVQSYVQDMYASFTNFFPGLRTVWLDK